MPRMSITALRRRNPRRHGLTTIVSLGTEEVTEPFLEQCIDAGGQPLRTGAQLLGLRGKRNGSTRRGNVQCNRRNRRRNLW